MTDDNMKICLLHGDEEVATSIKNYILNLDVKLEVMLEPFSENPTFENSEYEAVFLINLNSEDNYFSLLDLMTEKKIKYDFMVVVHRYENTIQQESLFLKGVSHILTMPVHELAIEGMLLKSLLKNKEIRTLEEKLKTATAMAFDAMSQSSEMGRVLSFVEKAMCARTFEEIADELMVVGRELDLNFILSIRMSGQEHNYTFSDIISSVHLSIIHDSRQKSRLYSQDDYSVFHHQHVSLMVVDLPVDDAHRCGVIRDLIAQLANTLEACVKSLSLEQILRRQSNNTLETVKQIKSISEENRLNLSKLLDSLLNDMKMSVSTMPDRDKVDNQYFDRMMQNCIEELENMHVNSMELEQKFLTTISGFKDAFHNSDNTYGNLSRGH